MTDHNPYDFLSEPAATDEPGDATSNGSSAAGGTEAPDLATVTVARQGSPYERVTDEEEQSAPETSSEGTSSEDGTSSELEVYDHQIPPAYDYEPLPPEAEGGWSEPPVNGAPPASPDYGAAPDPYVDPNAPVRDKELDLFDHLKELRLRLLHMVGAVAVTMIATWYYTNDIQDWLLQPINSVLKAHGVKDGRNPGDEGIVMLDPTEAFTTYFQISLVSALIFAMPYILWHMWRFLEPALTHKERRYTTVLLPFSIILFVAGATLGYAMSPLFFQFFVAFVPQSVKINWSYQSSILLLAKMLLVFGVCFQVPVVTIFINKIGLVSRNILIEYWRHVVVVIFTIVAILTPTWDPITLTACALPPCILYGLSIWLVKWL